MDEDGSAQSGQQDVGCVEITEISKPVAVIWIWSMSIPSGSGSSGVFSITPSFLATKQSPRGFFWKRLYHDRSICRFMQASGMPPKRPSAIPWAESCYFNVRQHEQEGVGMF